MPALDRRGVRSRAAARKGAGRHDGRGVSPTVRIRVGLSHWGPGSNGTASQLKRDSSKNGHNLDKVQKAATERNCSMNTLVNSAIAQLTLSPLEYNALLG